MVTAAVPDPDAVLGDPEWVAAQVEWLVDAAVHARERAGKPRMAIAQRVRRGYEALSDAGRKVLRERAYRAWAEIERAATPTWARGPEFDQARERRKGLRRRRRKVTEASRRRRAAEARKAQPPEEAPTLQQPDGDLDVPGLTFAVRQLMVVVAGPWGWLGIGTGTDAQGRVHVEGRMAEAAAHALLDAALQQPNSRLQTNRIDL